MVQLGICTACRLSDHQHCSGSVPPYGSTGLYPVFGGFTCMCPCRGDKDYKDNMDNREEPIQ